MKEAKEFVCKKLSKKRFTYVRGFGKMAVRDLDGKTYYTEPIGCEIGR